MDVKFVAFVLHRTSLARLLASFACNEELGHGLGAEPVERNRSELRCGTSLHEVHLVLGEYVKETTETLLGVISNGNKI